MIRAEARVVALESNGAAWVEVAGRASACGNCASAGSCRTDILGGGSREAPRRYLVPNTIGAVIGDRVSLAVTDGAILRASWLSYLLPAMLAIAGAALGQHLGGDVAALAATLLGLVAGFAHLGWRGRARAAAGGELHLERPQATACNLTEQS